MKRRYLPAHLREGLGAATGEFLSPRLQVLPQGWSWSLHLCQTLVEAAVDRSGLAAECRLRDHLSIMPLAGDDYAHAQYVDNFLVLAAKKEVADEKIEVGVAELERHGLICKPRCGAACDGEEDVLGITWHGGEGYLAMSNRRLWKLRLAILELLRRGRCSALQLQRVIGHLTWGCMLRREGLCMISACYAQIQALGLGVGTLWPACRRELFWVASLLPLLTANLWRPWDPVLSCSDASELGFGIVTQNVGKDVVSQAGRVSERWRFDVEDSVAARSSALANARGLDLPKVNRALAELEEKRKTHVVTSRVTRRSSDFNEIDRPC